MIFSKYNLPPGYYVYLYLRKEGTPYYVGKGCGVRAFRKGCSANIKIVAIHLTEHEAFILEKTLIAIYGRKDIGTGILRNMTDGGEGTSGWIPTSDNKRNISISKIGQGKNSIWWNNGIIEKKCVNYPGIDWTKGRLPLLNIGYATVNKKWWNNGTKEKMSCSCPGEEWISGKLISDELSLSISNRSKGKTWWNNGMKNKRSFTKPGDEWQPGFVKFKSIAK